MTDFIIKNSEKKAILIKKSYLVLLCTYISIGLIFLPKMLHLFKTPNSPDENYGIVGRRTGISNSCSSATTLHNLSSNYKSDQNRFQQLMKENSELKRQIELVKICFIKLFFRNIFRFKKMLCFSKNKIFWILIKTL